MCIKLHSRFPDIITSCVVTRFVIMLITTDTISRENFGFLVDLTLNQADYYKAFLINKLTELNVSLLEKVGVGQLCKEELILSVAQLVASITNWPFLRPRYGFSLLPFAWPAFIHGFLLGRNSPPQRNSLVHESAFAVDKSWGWLELRAFISINSIVGL